MLSSSNILVCSWGKSQVFCFHGLSKGQNCCAHTYTHTLHLRQRLFFSPYQAIMVLQGAVKWDSSDFQSGSMKRPSEYIIASILPVVTSRHPHRNESAESRDDKDSHFVYLVLWFREQKHRLSQICNLLLSIYLNDKRDALGPSS